MENNNEKSFLKKFKSSVYSFIFGLPFSNYNNLYKTGKIQKMSKEEKTKLIIDLNKETQHRKFFQRLLRMRSTFLDDEDQQNYQLQEQRIKNYRGAIIFGLFINWNYFSYNFIVKKKIIYKPFLSINLLLIIIYIGLNQYNEFKQEDLFLKYKDILNQEDVFRIMKKSYGID